MLPIDETQNKRLVIVVSHETAKAIGALAKQDRRPVSAYVRCVMEDHVKAAELFAAADRMEPGSGCLGILPPPDGL